MGEEGLKIGRVTICRRGTEERDCEATDVWRTVRGAPHFTTAPACSSGAESAAVTLKLYHFHPDKKQERSLSSELQVGHIMVLLIYKEERKEGRKKCCSLSFHKINHFIMTSNRVSRFFFLSSADRFEFFQF